MRGSRNRSPGSDPKDLESGSVQITDSAVTVCRYIHWGGRWGGRPPLERRCTMKTPLQTALFNTIQAPVHHWAPSLGEILHPPLPMYVCVCPVSGVWDEGGPGPLWEEAHSEQHLRRRDGARPQTVPTQRGRGKAGTISLEFRCRQNQNAPLRQIATAAMLSNGRQIQVLSGSVITMFSCRP